MQSSRRFRASLIGLLALVAPLFLTTSAQASTFVYGACQTGNQVSPPDFTYTTTNSHLDSTNSCASASGSLRINNDKATATVPGGADARWHFYPPADTEISSVTTNACLQSRGGFNSQLWIRDAATGSPVLFAAGVLDCDWTNYTGTVAGSEFFSQLRCGDGSGCTNSAATAATYIRNMNVTLRDKVNPTATLSGPLVTGSATLRGNQDVTGTPSDLGGGVRTTALTVNAQDVTPVSGGSATQTYGCSLFSDGSGKTTARVPCPLNPAASNWTLNTAASPFHDGSNTVQLCATEYGTGATPQCVTKTVSTDNTAPRSTISPPKPDSYTKDKNPTFTGTVNEDADLIECSLDGGSWANCKTAARAFSKSYSNLPDTPDPHTFRVRAKDLVGNQEDKSPSGDTSDNTYTWTIDNTPPETYIDEHPGNAPGDRVYDHNAHFAFHAVDASSAPSSNLRYKCRRYKGSHDSPPSEVTDPFIECSSPQDFAVDDGDWVFEVRGRDGLGNEDSSADYWEWTVSTRSNECNVPVYDGYTGTAYVRVSLLSDPDKDRQVCYRVDDGPGGEPTTGGAIVISNPGASAPEPTQEDVTCPEGNVTDFAVAGNRFAIWQNATVGQTVVCVQADPVGKRRITFTTPGAAVTPPTNVPDDPSAITPGPKVSDPSYPSSTCQNAPESERSQIMNGDAGTASHVWLYERKPSASVVQLCARAEGPVNVGGMLEIDAGGLGTLTPIEDIGSGTGPCTLSPPIFTMSQPVPLYINTSPLGSNPASICVGSGSTTEHVTLGASGSLLIPHVTWKPDPGTPPGFQVGPLP